MSFGGIFPRRLALHLQVVLSGVLRSLGVCGDGQNGESIVQKCFLFESVRRNAEDDLNDKAVGYEGTQPAGAGYTMVVIHG